MASRRICKVDRHAFYMDDRGLIHEYGAQSRTLDPKTGETFIEGEDGSREPLETGLWLGVPGEFVPWYISHWKREAAVAYGILSTIPPNFLYDHV